MANVNFTALFSQSKVNVYVDQVLLKHITV